MFSTPAHKQLDPSKQGAQRVEPARLALCAGFENGGDYRLPAKAPAFDVTGQIIAHESGELDQDATVELFQHLIDTGLVWQLQGSYGRAATQLIQMGLCARAARDLA